MVGGGLLERFRRYRNRAVWWIEEMGYSGMEPSHRADHPVHRSGPGEDVVVFGVRREDGSEHSPDNPKPRDPVGRSVDDRRK
jgi:hypothetical protein